MKEINPIPKGLRPCGAIRDKVQEIVAYLQTCRIAPGNGIQLLETPSGIIISCSNETQEMVRQQAVFSSSWVPARVKSGSAETGYTVDLYERGKDNGITTSDVTVFLPYAMYGAAIPAGSWIMVTQSQTIVIPDEEDGV